MQFKLSEKIMKPDFQGEFTSSILKAGASKDIISFAGGLPNPASFPVKEMEAAVQKVLEKNGAAALQYSTTEGYEPLRAFIAKRYEKMGVDDVKPEDIINARDVVKDVYMDEKIRKYIVDIVFATRTPADYNLKKYQEMISYGASPRAGISMAQAAKAYAFIKRRGYVIPEDVRAVCPDVMRHRIGLSYEAEANNITTEEMITDILNVVEVP